MAAFGFDTAVTSLGHFGTGFSNTFDINDNDRCMITNCDLSDLIIQVMGSVNVLINKVEALEANCKKLLDVDDHWEFLYSAIRDIRREILRGKNLGR